MAGDTVDEGSLNQTGVLLKPSDADVGDRHKGGINGLWVDGHVQFKRKAVLEAGRSGNIDYYFEVNK